MLALRMLIAMLVLPGTLAGVIPFLLLQVDRSRVPGTRWLPAYALLALGLCVFLWCVYDFFAVGKGTLAPWDPPRHLVITGPYRYCRNPMYVGVLLTLAGWAALVGSVAMAEYAVLVAGGFHARVVWGEEPTLRRVFGAEFDRYVQTVPRWVPRLPVGRVPA